MKFFHLSDLHIGKQLHRYNLKEDQQVIASAASRPIPFPDPVTIAIFPSNLPMIYILQNYIHYFLITKCHIRPVGRIVVVYTSLAVSAKN